MDAIRKLTPADQRYVENTLSKLSSGSGRAVGRLSNFYLEFRLNETSWDNLTKAILATRASTATNPTIWEVLTRWCQATKLNGPIAKIGSGRLVGRAQDCDALVSSIVNNPKNALFAPTRLGLTAEMLRYRRSPFRLRNIVKPYFFTRHVAWATFNRSGNSPFTLTGTATPMRLRALLGLPQQKTIADTFPLMIMEYVLPPNVSARIPTVADAFASPVDGWSYYFVVNTDRKGTSGLLRAWDGFDDDPSAPLPEIVHDPVSGDSLVNVWELR